METKKTAPEWFHELPDGYRQRALRACTNKTGLCDSMHLAISVGIHAWADTIEKFEFWNAMWYYYFAISNGDTTKSLPPLPPDAELDKSKEAESKPAEFDENDFELKLTIVYKDGMTKIKREARPDITATPAHFNLMCDIAKQIIIDNILL